MTLLRIDRLRKEYRGGVVPNDNISLSVEPGECKFLSLPFNTK